MTVRAVRRTARVLGAVALVAPALVAFSAGTASAAQSISSPSDGTVYTSNQTVTVSGSFAGCSQLATSCPSGTLSVTDPGGASAGSTTKTATRGSSSTSLSLTVSVNGNNRNGTYRVSLSSAGSTSTSSFYANIAPATPSGFDASTTDGDPHDVLLSWSKGTEPDLQSYTVYDGDGNVLQGGISAKSACSGSSCTYSLYYDNPTPGTYSYSYTLTSSRSGGCASSSCPTLESGKTGASSASLTTPKPPPSPTPQPQQGGGSGGTTSSGGGSSSTGGSTSSGGSSTGSGSTSGGSTSSSGSSSGTGGSAGTTTPTSPIPLPTLDPGIQKRAFALNFSNFSASLGIPKLPPLPKTDTVSLPGGEEAIPQGTYNPQLPYKPATETVKSKSLAGDPIGYVSAVDWTKVAKPLAMALILVLVAAHLRRWIGLHSEE